MIKSRNEIKETVISKIAEFDFANDFVIDALNDKQYSYDALFKLAQSYSSNILLSTGEKRIVCIFENSLELLILYFALILTDKSIVVIDPQKSKDEIQTILDELGEYFLICDDKTSEFFKADCTTSSLKQTQVTEIDDCKEAILAKISDRDFNSEYLITFTSGTTGKNKGVRHSLASLLWTALEFNEKFNVCKNNNFGHVMPMTYMAGILNSIFQPFIAESKIVILGRFSPMLAIKFWQQVSTNNIDTMWVSPGMLTLIQKLSNKNLGVDYCNTKDIKFFVGTAPLSKQFQIEFEDLFNVELFGSYGLSETLYISTQTAKTKQENFNQNVGELLSSVELLIDDDGELLVNVPWMFLGYSNENSDSYFQEKFYKTGDYAFIENNTLAISGRKKELIIRGGLNISPTAIENVIIESKIVDDCAVFGIKDIKINDEKIVLAHTQSSKSELKELSTQINRIIIDKLGINYIVDFFFYVPQITKNINGKTDKPALKELFTSTHNDY